jgi:hypothetical protein
MSAFVFRQTMTRTGVEDQTRIIPAREQGL